MQKKKKNDYLEHKTIVFIWLPRLGFQHKNTTLLKKIIIPEYIVQDTIS